VNRSAREAPPGRPAMAVLLLVVFVNLVGFGILMPILPFYAQAFHAAPWQVTLMFTAFSLGNVVAEPVWGRLSDRIGRRPILLGTIFASGLGFLGLAFAPNIWVALAIRLATGLATGNLSTIQGYIADITPPAHRSGRIGLLGAAFALGYVAGPALGGLLAQPQRGPDGFDLPLYLAAGLSMLAALGVAVFVREGRNRPEADPQAPVFQFTLLREARRHPVLGRALVITLLYASAFAAAESTFGLWTQHHYGWGPRQLSYCFAGVAVTAALAQAFVTGRVTRRFGEVAMLTAGLALISATLALQPVAGGPSRTVILLAVTVLGQALTLPNISALISRTTPHHRQGAMLGLNTSIGALARAIGPAAGGALFSFLGPDAPLYTAAIVTAPAIVLAWRAGEAVRRTNAGGRLHVAGQADDRGRGPGDGGVADPGRRSVG
jgi:DHA1 family tetracycline resistance protein-like MFS transporter